MMRTLIILSFSLTLFTAQLFASTCLVINTHDDGPGSLRQIIRDELCDTITFDPTIASDTISLINGELVIHRDIVLMGKDELTISANYKSRVIRVKQDVHAFIYNVSIIKGSATLEFAALDSFAGPGGGIRNAGNLNLRGCRLHNNSSGPFGHHQPNDGRGGAIYNSGNLTIYQCEFSENSSGKGEGGAIYNDLNAHLDLSASSIHHNSNSIVTDRNPGFVSGGMIHNRGNAKITNSTISENSGGYFGLGGAILNGSSGNISVNFCTIVNNGPGFLNGGHLTLGNSILAFNNCDGDCDGRNNGTIVSNGYNLIRINNFDFPRNTGDQLGTLDSPLNPLLDGLSNNGGSLPTHALLQGSPAINAADPNSSLDTDQRGYLRPHGSRADIGSFESDIDCDLNITGFTLIDADTELPVAGYDPIPEGAKIDLEALGIWVPSFRANTCDERTQSVELVLSGPRAHRNIENVMPYALFGDNSGDYSGRPMPQGDYQLEGIAYKDKNGQGVSGSIKTLNFSITGSLQRIGKEQLWNIYPNPTKDILYIRIGQLRKAEVFIYNQADQLVYHSSIKNELETSIDLKQLPEGIYTIQIQAIDFNQSKRFIHIR